MAAFPLLLSFMIPLVRTLSSWDRPGRKAKGSLQRAATARTADGKNWVNVRRHELRGRNVGVVIILLDRADFSSLGCLAPTVPCLGGLRVFAIPYQLLRG